MDDTLLDSDRKSSKFLEYAGAGAVLAFVAFTVIAAMVLGVKHKIWAHFVFAVLSLLVLGILVILVMWWGQGDLDPKFKWLMAFTAFVVLFTGIAANIYIWQPLPIYPSQLCYNKWRNDSFYNWGTGQCLQISNMEACQERKHGYCIQMSSDLTGACFNCTATPPHPPVPPTSHKRVKVVAEAKVLHP